MLKLIIVLAVAGCLFAQVVEFTAQGRLMSGGEVIDVGSYAAPLMVDWNGDGLQDLLAGQFEEGRIRYYENEGTSSSPVFSGYQYLRDGGSILSVPAG